jgi:hypothetical protein
MNKTVKEPVEINNVPDYADARRYWVVKYCAGRLWFYGAYAEENRALDVANDEEGMVIEHE